MGVLAQSIAVEKLIPQRKPMVFIDFFDGLEDGVSHTSFTVPDECLFVEQGRLTECGLIEHMAQSAAARVGWLRLEAGEPVPVGFIGAVSRFTACSLPRVGSTLRTSLRVVQQVGPLSLVEACTEVGAETVARGNLKIFLQE